jgi:hypothetical protein
MSKSVKTKEPPCTERYARWCERSVTQLMGDLLLNFDEMDNLKSDSIAVDANEVHVGTATGTDEDVAGVGSKLGIDQSKVQAYKLVKLDEFDSSHIDASGNVSDSKVTTDNQGDIVGNYMLEGNGTIDVSSLKFGDGSGIVLPFAGKLDGLDNTVTGLTLSSDNTGLVGVGLFKQAVTGSQFDNLNFSGSNISNISSGYSYCTANLIAEIVQTKNGDSVKLNNITVANGSISVSGSGSNAPVGGIIGGSVYALKLYNVKNIDNDISVTTEQEKSDVGGIVGYVSSGSTIINAYNSGTIDTDSAGVYIGGIAGVIYSSSDSPTKIAGIENNGTVNGLGNIGGLAGGFQTYDYFSISVDHAYNAGSISGLYNVGGLVGGICINPFGPVEVEAVPTSVSTMAVTVPDNNIKFTYAHNAGEVDGGGYVGGIIGLSEADITVNQSWNNGDIKAGQYAGGIIGNASASADLNQDYNAGTIIYNRALEQNNLYTTNDTLMSMSTGDEDAIAPAVTGGLTYAGGLIGYAGKINNYKKVANISNKALFSVINEPDSVMSGTHLNITDSYNTGNIGEGVGAMDNVYGGLVGATSVNTMTITRSFNTGKLTVTQEDGGYMFGTAAPNVYYPSIPYDMVGGLIGYVGNPSHGILFSPPIIESNDTLTALQGGGTDTISLTISQSHNLGEIVSSSYDNEINSVGGLIGEMDNDIATKILDSNNFKGGYTDANGNRQMIQSYDGDLITNSDANGLIGYVNGDIGSITFTNSHNYDDMLIDQDYAKLKSDTFMAYGTTQAIDYQGRLHNPDIEAGLLTDYPDGGVIWKLYESMDKAQDGSTLYELPLLTAFQTKVEQQAMTVDAGKTYGMGDLRYTVTMPDGQRMTDLTWDTVLALAQQRNAVDDHMTDASVNDHNGTLALTATGTYDGSTFYPHYDSNQHGLNIFTNTLTINEVPIPPIPPIPPSPPSPPIPGPQFGKLFFDDGSGKIDSDIHIAPFILIDNGGFQKDSTPIVLASVPVGTMKSTGSKEKKGDELNG